MSVQVRLDRRRRTAKESCWVAVLVCSSLAGGCHDEPHDPDPDHASSGGPTTDGAGGAGIPDPSDEAIDRFFMEYAASVCVMYRSCCLSEERGYDGAGCTEQFREVLEARLVGEFQEDAAGHCLVALAEVSAQDPDRCSAVKSFDEATLLAECSAAFVPLARAGVELGADCNFAYECASSALGSVTCFEGRCLLQRPGEAGEGPCLFGSSLAQAGASEVVTCETRRGLYCHLDHDVCETLGNVGDECPHFGSCIPEAICLSQRCERLPLRGEDCLDTNPRLCALGSACVDELGVCGTPLPAGEACNDSFQCSSGFCRGGYCADPEFFTKLSCTGEE